MDYFTSGLDLSDPDAAFRRGFTSIDKHDHHLITRIENTLNNGDRLFIIDGPTRFSWDQGTTEADAFDMLARTLTKVGATARFIVGPRTLAHPCHGRHGRRWAQNPYRLTPHVSTTDMMVAAGEDTLIAALPYTSHIPAPAALEQWRLRDMGAPLIHGTPANTDCVLTHSDNGSIQYCVDFDLHNGLVSKKTLFDHLDTALVGTHI